MFRENPTQKPSPAAQSPGEDNSDLLTYVFIAFKPPRPNTDETSKIFAILLIINQNYNNALNLNMHKLYGQRYMQFINVLLYQQNCNPGTVYINFLEVISFNNWSCKLQNMLNPIFGISVFSAFTLCVCINSLPFSTSKPPIRLVSP